MSKLVIVESPAKVKKIQQFLGSEYKVDSCVGHIRDLPRKKSEVPAAIKDEPWADFGVNVDDGFKPYYITIHGKGKVVAQLKKKLKDADELFLATDEDREGESISWHLVEALQPKVPVRRMVFNEITKKAVQEAVEHPRDIDLDLVQAQETRRILDRLYGYALSPLLWKKVGGNLSAGRVQSVAVRLVVDRERERRAFVTGSYWDLTAHLELGEAFDARLLALDGKRIATGKDFDKDTGAIKDGLDVVLLDEAGAKSLQSELGNSQWTIADLQSEQKQRKPAPPFITSTLQQDASNRLNMSARDAMRTAQRLYENGFITYMRTDSVALSEEAITGARAAIQREFGDAYVPSEPRHYQGKKSKNAQEAHEAIRPAGDAFIHPDQSGLAGAELKLYRLIWRRTLASQMPNEQSTHTTASIEADGGSVANVATFNATGKKVDFPGWRLAYPAQGEETGPLPQLKVGDHPGCTGVDADGHETKPPARFTEASLVAALEKEGIGRPSTYASIMDTIQSKGYAIKKGKALVPSFTAFAVVGLLEKNFANLIDTKFTANMEEVLDQIASGEAEWQPFLNTFFHGPDGLKAQVDAKMESMDPETARIVDLGQMPYTVKIGRFGPYVEMDHEGERVSASIPEAITPDELDQETVERLLRERTEGPTSIGDHPETGLPIYVKEGRFGPYYQMDNEGDAKPKTASLPKGKGVDDASLDEAIKLLSLPRAVGDHPEGGRVITNVGPYGPYVAWEKPDKKRDFRSLPDFDALHTVELEEALKILATPKAGRRGAQILKEVGDHPDDGKPIQVLSGRYGPYVKHDKTNATIPKGTDPAEVSLEVAVRLIAEKKSKKKR